MAEVLRHHRALQGIRRAGVDVHPGGQGQHTRLGGPGLPGFILRRIQCPGAQALLAADLRPLLSSGLRCLVDGCERTEHTRLHGHGLPQGALRPDCPGKLNRVLQRLRPDERGSNLRRTAGRGPGQARIPAHQVRILRTAALQHRHLERRHCHEVGGYARPAHRRTQLLRDRHTVLDHGHRRLLRGGQVRTRTACIRQHRQGKRGPQGVEGAQHPLVPVRSLRPALPRPRAVPVQGDLQPGTGRTSCLRVNDLLYAPALQAHALPLFPCRRLPL